MGVCGSHSEPKDDKESNNRNNSKPLDKRAYEDDSNSDSDFLFFIETESDSDEIKLDPTEEGYPEPKPCEDGKLMINVFPLTKDDNIDENDNNILTQEQLDNHARNAPAAVSGSFEELISYLEEPFKGNQQRDNLLVRAILAWLSNQKIGQSSMPGNTETPSGYLVLLGVRKTTYSTFFTVICRKAGIICAQIHGVAKAGDYQPGDKDGTKFGCLWNAVYLQDNWHIIHPFWACCSVFGKVSGGWIKLEAGGKTVAKRTIEASGTLQNAFEDYYIMPNPKEFLYACHPDDTKWQLVDHPISRKEFFEKAYLLPPFWGLGMELLTQDLCSLSSKKGNCFISLKTPLKTGNEFDVWYELLYKEKSGETQTDLLDPKNIPKLVTLVRNTPEWHCRIKFPVKGTYKLVIYGGKYQQTLFRLGEFQLICNEEIQNCQPLPFDPGRLAIGPGPAAEKAGLLMPSHRNGMIYVDKNKLGPVVVRFFVDCTISRTLVVKTELVNNKSITDEHLQQTLNEYVNWSIEQSGKENNLQTTAKELKITTDIHSEGDYYLRIYTGHSSMQQTEAGNEEMSVVCNYNITTLNRPAFESGSKRFARRNLLAAIEGDNLDELHKCILFCERANMKHDDPDLDYARRKVEVLTYRRDIHEARMRRHLKTTEFTIKQIKNSEYINIFRRDIQLLERFAEHLRSLKGYTQELPWLLDALIELFNRHVPNDVVKNVLVALLVLFGEDVRTTEEFEDIQVYSKRLYGKIINQKESNFDKNNAKKANDILKRFTYEETQFSTMAATKMYKWIRDVTQTVLQDFNSDS